MKKSGQNAFTLIETVAVITAIALMTVALLLPVVRRLDEAVRQKEVATLATVTSAFKTRVTATRRIPNETGWAAEVAAVTGWQLNVVTNNDRGLRRVFLIDPALRIGTNGAASLSYTQSFVGHTYTNASGVIRPVNPRLMILSSIGATLPTNLVNGVAASSGVYAFNNIWGTADGAIPSGWSWSGRGSDLVIQRIDLSDLFVRVALNNRDSASTLPTYSVSSNLTDFVTGSLAAATCRTPMYFFKGSEIRLYNVAGTLEHSEILSKSQSFTFEKGTWEPEAYIATGVGQTSALDLQKAMNLFVAGPPNTNAQAGATQTTISNLMAKFMTEYVAWRDGNPSYKVTGGNKPPAQLDKAQSDLQTAMANLINPQ